MPEMCSMCEVNPAVTSYGLPVCQPCYDGLVATDAELRVMEAEDPDLKAAGERVEESARKYLSENDERAKTSCNTFVDSGETFNMGDEVNLPLCQCGWTVGTHHVWKRMTRPNGALGSGWACRVCGRTAYDIHGRCSPESPPVDYPSCSTWSSNS